MTPGRVIPLGHPRHVGTDEPWMTKREIAGVLGFSVRWVEYRVREGMPCETFGGRLRFQRGRVEAWLMDEERRTA